MRVTSGARRGASVVLGAFASVLLAAPAYGAALPVLDVSEQLIEEQVAPAPLIPTYVPPAMARGRAFIESGWARGRVYSMRILHVGARGTDGVIALQRCAPVGSAAFGTCTGLAATQRYEVRQGFRSQPTRVRGKPGFLLTRGPDRTLIWREDGLVHSIGSATPRKVSVAGLRATAAGLDRLQNRYQGSSPDPDSSTEALLVTSARFISGRVQWQATCGGPDGSTRAGSAELVLVPRRGNAFAFDIAQATSDLARGWSGGISGVIGPGTVALSITASGVFDGVACDTGALALSIPRFDKSPLSIDR